MLTCKRARLHIALAVGGDLDETGEAAMNAHLADCPPCTQHLQTMKSNLRPLHERDDESLFTLHDSLWPDLNERLPDRSSLRQMRYNGWWAASAVFVACIAIAMFWQKQSEAYRDWKSETVAVPHIDHDALSNGPQYSVLQPSFGRPRPEPKRVRKFDFENFFRLPDSQIELPFLSDQNDSAGLYERR